MDKNDSDISAEGILVDIRIDDDAYAEVLMKEAAVQSMTGNVTADAITQRTGFFRCPGTHSLRAK